MLTDEQLIDQIRSELRDELSALHTTGQPPRQLWQEARAAQRRRSRVLIGRLPGLIATASALAVATLVVVLVLGTVGVRHSPGSSAAGSAGIRREIVAADGQVLARSVKLAELRLYPGELPRSAAARLAEQTRLNRLLKRYHINLFTPMTLVGARLNPRAIVLKGHSLSLATYVSAHQRQFPGFRVSYRLITQYPLHQLAAPIAGAVGPLTAAAHEPQYRGLPLGTVVGRSGLEYSYDSYLRHGDTLKLSLDPALQRVGDQALQHAIESDPPADGGAFVAMNPQTGAIHALGSLPTYDPNILDEPTANGAFQRLNNPASDYPLLDRAIQFAGPVGSTFDPITALAALQNGAWTVGDVFDDTGQYCFTNQCRQNPGAAAHGPINVARAIQLGSDDFFYNLGVLTNNPAPSGGALQHWARLFGIGRPTGVDIAGEVSGALPTPAWRAERNKLEAECDNATGPFAGKPKHPPGGCGIADGTNRPWSPGDNENLAVGQGDVQVTPLQLAVAYAAIANGGTIVRPHLGASLERSGGSVLSTIDPPPIRRVNLNSGDLNAVREGLRGASSHGGTSANVFDSFPEPVYGQFGSAQYVGQPDYAWYAGYVPATATNKPIVVVVMVQKVGFGVDPAAPVARQILSQWFSGRRGPWVPGNSRTP